MSAVDRTSPRWRRLRAACGSISGLTEHELDVQADRVYAVTARHATTDNTARAGAALEGVCRARAEGGKAR